MSDKTVKDSTATSPLIVTIDGPSAAGKGTISYLLSKRFGLMDIDSGALFRAITWLALREKIAIEPDNGQKIALLAKRHKIRLLSQDVESVLKMGVMVDETDVSKVIRTEALSRVVPLVSQMAEVREVVLDLQHKIAAAAPKGVIIEGRDTGTVVFPQAQVKVFLTASAEERAQRRHAEFVSQGKEITFEEVYSDLVARDFADTERTLSPLTKPDGAVVIDSTGKTIEDVVEKISTLIEKASDTDR